MGAEAPACLTDREREYWDYYAPRLVRTGVLTEADRDTLRLYVEALAQVDAVRTEQARLGGPRLVVSTTTSRDGHEVTTVRAHPLDAQRRAWSLLVRLYGADLGLSPSSRGRVATVEAADDPLETFLRRVK